MVYGKNSEIDRIQRLRNKSLTKCNNEIIKRINEVKSFINDNHMIIQRINEIKEHQKRIHGIKPLVYEVVALNTLKETIIDTRKKIRLLFFYIDWCPISMMDKIEWDKFVLQINNKDFDNHLLVCHTINCSKYRETNYDKNEEYDTAIMRRELDIYPNVKMILCDNDAIEYTDSIDIVSLHEFINKNIDKW
jgi:hypothetical protein